MKKQYHFLILIILIVLAPTNISAESYDLKSSTETVNVTGYGTSYSEARRDAEKNAIQQLIGMYTVSDEKLNDETIKDQFLSQSTGFIREFVIKQQGKTSDQLFFITADVTVSSTQLKRRLGELNIGLKELGTEKHTKLPESHENLFKSKDDLRTAIDTVIYDPLIANRNVYVSDVTEIEIIEYPRSKYHEICWLDYQEPKLAEIGKLIPVRITFRHGLSAPYLNRVISFLNSNAEKKKDKDASISDSFGKFVTSIGSKGARGSKNDSTANRKNKGDQEYSIKISEPRLKSTNYSNHWTHTLEFSTKKEYSLIPDSGNIFKQQANTFLNRYFALTVITLLGEDGSVVGIVPYGGTGRYSSYTAHGGHGSHYVPKENYAVSASEKIDLIMESSGLFSSRTAQFKIDDLFLMSCLSRKENLEFMSSVTKNSIIVFLTKEQFTKMRNIRIETLWKQKGI